jgi:hypothetical protein
LDGDVDDSAFADTEVGHVLTPYSFRLKASPDGLLDDYLTASSPSDGEQPDDPSDQTQAIVPETKLKSKKKSKKRTKRTKAKKTKAPSELTRNPANKWTPEEDALLLKLVNRVSVVSAVAREFPRCC